MPDYTQWGYLGAVVFLVVSFGAFLIKRDKEWRDFFTLLNANNKDDVKTMAAAMERMIKTLDTHDDQAKVILNIVSEVDKRTGKIDSDLTHAFTVMQERTQPLPRQARKGSAD
jgi:hypothetical protein